MRLSHSILASLALFLTVAGSVWAATPREQLQELTVQLQQAPADNALRERIIRLGAEIKPAPAIPPEANRAFVKGGVFLKEAKGPADHELAVVAYREALLIAPWWGDAYFNLAAALEAAGKYEEAIASSKLYIASVPAASADATEAQNRIYALEAKSEMASRQTASLAAAEAERKRPTVEGRWAGPMYDFEVIRTGDSFRLIPGTLMGRPGQWVATDPALEFRRIRFGWKNLYLKCPDCSISRIDVSLSDDGSALAGTATLNGEVYQITFSRAP